MIFSPSGHGLSLPLCIFSDQLQLLVKLTQLNILLSPVGVDGIKSLQNFSHCKQLPLNVGNRNKSPNLFKKYIFLRLRRQNVKITFWSPSICCVVE